MLNVTNFDSADSRLEVIAQAQVPPDSGDVNLLHEKLDKNDWLKVATSSFPISPLAAIRSLYNLNRKGLATKNAYSSFASRMTLTTCLISSPCSGRRPYAMAFSASGFLRHRYAM